MANRNAYLTYKYETSRIIYWVVQTSNEIFKSLAADPTVDADNDDHLPKGPNLSGQVTVSGLVTLARLISRHVDQVPTTILRLFRSVIDARTATHATFQQFVALNPDPDIIKSNDSHKRFIDALHEAFNALGGDAALKTGSSTETNTPSHPSIDSKEDMDQILLSNKFAKLDVQGDNDIEPPSDDDVEGPSATSSSAPARRKQPKPGKGKKGKRSKKPKKTVEPKVEAETLPLESYRIIQDTEGEVTDYLIAVYQMMEQVTTLRSKMQEIWREVAYDGLNSAVAGAVSHVAVGMVQRTATAMFVDFPGHDSFDTVMNTITRGNIEKAQGMFTVSLYQGLIPDDSDSDPTHHYRPGGPRPGGMEKVVEHYIDVREQFLIHAYNDLLDFVLDYQKNRNGKPTKKMQAEIKDWDPNFKLHAAGVTNEQRLQWRRSYTINWLYDLVNVFSSVVVQRNNVKKEGHILENVDWSPSGQWGDHRLIFGLAEFASFVTGLAMQKPGTDVRKRILPHHVFQLQLIVDSLTVTRGWSLSLLRGHVVVPPPRGFRPRRDVDLFLDRENKRMFHGFLQGADVLEQFLEREIDEYQGTAAMEYAAEIEIIRLMRLDFCDWLGETKYMHGLNTIPPSRFSKTNSNGLWEYSPMLCGTGLTEALVLAYELGMWVWDRTPEITYLVHLHNMLHKRGFIPREIGLFATLEDVFPKCFYPDGKVPNSDFHNVLHRHVMQAPMKARARGQDRRAAAAATQNTGYNLYELFNVELNMMFKTKSDLLLYCQAKWDPDRVPDSEITLGSVLMGLRLADTKRIIDPVTGEAKLEETDLVRRVKEFDRQSGKPDSTLDRLAEGFAHPTAWNAPSQLAEIPKMLAEQLEKDLPNYHASEQPLSRQREPPGGGKKRMFRGMEVTDDVLLEFLKLDIMRDVCGYRPLSSLNYLWVAARMKMIFMQIEEALQKARYPIYRDSYESGARELDTTLHKRYALVYNACKSDDSAALRAMAEVFENPRAGFMNHIYWDDLLQSLELPRTEARREQEEILASEPTMCSVM